MKRVMAAVFCLNLLMSSICSADTLPVMPLSELTEEQWQDFYQGQGDFFVIVEKDTIVPLKLSLHGSLLALEGNESAQLLMKALGSFYIHNTEGQFLFSTDLVQWKPLSEFVTGQCNMTLLMENGEPAAHISLEFNERTET